MKLYKIKDVLDSKGISQTWLTKQLGKSFSTVYKKRNFARLLSTELS